MVKTVTTVDLFLTVIVTVIVITNIILACSIGLILPKHITNDGWLYVDDMNNKSIETLRISCSCVHTKVKITEEGIHESSREEHHDREKENGMAEKNKMIPIPDTELRMIGDNEKELANTMGYSTNNFEDSTIESKAVKHKTTSETTTQNLQTNDVTTEEPSFLKKLSEKLSSKIENLEKNLKSDSQVTTSDSWMRYNPDSMKKSTQSILENKLNTRTNILEDFFKKSIRRTTIVKSPRQKMLETDAFSLIDFTISTKSNT